MKMSAERNAYAVPLRDDAMSWRARAVARREYERSERSKRQERRVEEGAWQARAGEAWCGGAMPCLSCAAGATLPMMFHGTTDAARIQKRKKCSHGEREKIFERHAIMAGIEYALL